MFRFAIAILSFLPPVHAENKPIKIPVIPFQKQSVSIPSKIHNRCKLSSNYNQCLKRLSINRIN